MDQSVISVATTTTTTLLGEGATLDLPSIEYLMRAGAVFPILAYPFMPSTGLLGIPRDVFLIWPSMLSLTYFYTVMSLEWSCGQPSFYPGPAPPWEITLMSFIMMAGFKSLSSPSREELKQGDFRDISTPAVVFTFCQLMRARLGENFYLLDGGDLAGSLRYLVRPPCGIDHRRASFRPRHLQLPH
jgi:hypothetical protein